MAVIKYLSDISLEGGQLLNALLQNLASAPSSPSSGRVYFDTTLNVARYYNGTEWVDITADDGDAATLNGQGPAHYLARGNHTGSQAIGTVSGLQSALDSKAADADLDDHTSDTSNPHNVTAAQAGADPVGSASSVQDNLDTHTSDTTNPHNVTATQAGAIPIGQKGSAGGVAELDGNALIPIEQLPPMATGDSFPAANQAAMLDLDAHIGDVAVRSDTDSKWLLVGTDPSVLSNWHELGSAVDVVESVAAGTGISVSGTANVTVALNSTTQSTLSDVSNKANQSDLTSHTNATNNPHSVTAAQVGASPTGHDHDDDYAPLSHNHNATHINAGIFDVARIPDLDAAKITSGTLNLARIPMITVAKGGTGRTTLTSGSYLRGEGTSQVALVTPANVRTDIGAAAASDLTSHTNATNNPHSVTAQQVGATRKYSTAITNPGVSNSITHSLGTQDIVVQTYLDDELVFVGVTIENNNEITLSLSSARTGSLRVVVIG